MTDTRTNEELLNVYADAVRCVAEGRLAWDDFDLRIEAVKKSRFAVLARMSSPSHDRAMAEGGWRDIASVPQDGTEVDLWIEPEDGPGYRRIGLHWGYPQHTCGEAGRYCDSCPPDEEGWLDEMEQFAFEEGEGQSVSAWMLSPAPPTPTTKGETD